MMMDQTDLNATCAFLATYLQGQPAWLLQDGSRPRESFVFTQSASHAWFERADIDPMEVHLSGSDGEHCYAIRRIADG